MEKLFGWISSNQQTIYIVILIIFLSIEVIGRIPAALHMPLMSWANAIHGVVLIGAIIALGGVDDDNFIGLIAGFLAVVFGTLNVVGGFMATDRLLEIVKKER